MTIYSMLKIEIPSIAEAIHRVSVSPSRWDGFYGCISRKRYGGLVPLKMISDAREARLQDVHALFVKADGRCRVRNIATIGSGVSWRGFRKGLKNCNQHYC